MEWCFQRGSSQRLSVVASKRSPVWIKVDPRNLHVCILAECEVLSVVGSSQLECGYGYTLTSVD